MELTFLCRPTGSSAVARVLGAELELVELAELELFQSELELFQPEPYLEPQC